ncbi:hypothetical protein NFI96_004726, partial [Prochilodus magdalenae]
GAAVQQIPPPFLGPLSCSWNRLRSHSVPGCRCVQHLYIRTDWGSASVGVALSHSLSSRYQLQSWGAAVQQIPTPVLDPAVQQIPTPVLGGGPLSSRYPLQSWGGATVQQIPTPILGGCCSADTHSISGAAVQQRPTPVLDAAVQQIPTPVLGGRCPADTNSSPGCRCPAETHSSPGCRCPADTNSSPGGPLSSRYPLQSWRAAVQQIPTPVLEGRCPADTHSSPGEPLSSRYPLQSWGAAVQQLPPLVVTYSNTPNNTHLLNASFSSVFRQGGTPNRAGYRPTRTAGVHPCFRVSVYQDIGLDAALLKHNMSAGFAEPYRSLKCLRADSDFYAAGGGGGGDASSLKLASSELDRLIGGVITSPSPGTGSGAAPIQQHLYARTIAEDQECFADGFVKALDELHKMNHVPPPNVALGGGTGVASSCAAAPVFPDAPVYATLNSCHPNTNLPPAASYPTATISYLPQYHHPHQHQHHHHQPHHFQHAARLAGLKEEPQTVPDLQGDGSPPTSPVDLEDQERMKAERKRLRNRLAATKCRRRKLERISRLEDKVKVLKSDNAGLSSAASLLREQVAQLKQKVMTHVSSGCQLMLAPKIKTVSFVFAVYTLAKPQVLNRTS